MIFSWLYHIPSFLFFLLVIGFFGGLSVLGYLLTRRYVERWLGPHPAQNEAIHYYIAATGVVYGIMLGLIAVAVWDNYKDVKIQVAQEAASLAALYRDVNSYPEPYHNKLTLELKDYTRYLVDEAWPLQAKGILPAGGVDSLTEFQQVLYSFEPLSEKQKIIDEACVENFNQYIELSRLRMENIREGSSSMIWWVVFFGGLVNTILSWLFVIESKSLHVLMNGLLGALIGSLIFIIIVLEFPFSGWFAVSSDPFQIVYQQLMK